MPRQETMRVPPTTKESMDILVQETCKKTKMTDQMVRELFNTGWKYHEANGQIMWIKA